MPGKRSTKIVPQQTHQAGEHYVAFQIWNRGGRCQPTTGNYAGIDLYASNADLTRHIGVQVKAKTSPTWQVNNRYGPRDKPEDEINYWVLVDLSGEGEPECYVMEAWWIEYDIHLAFEQNLEAHGGTRPHNPASKHHAIAPSDVEQWKDRWDLMRIF